MSSASAMRDALGRPIPDEGDLRLHLDDDLYHRRAPDGWVHLTTAREVCLLLLTRSVVELSLDNDLGPSCDTECAGAPDDELKPTRYGEGRDVVDFLDYQHGVRGLHLWPEHITLHTSNRQAADGMARTILTAARRHSIEVEEISPAGTKRRFRIPASRRS